MLISLDSEWAFALYLSYVRRLFTDRVALMLHAAEGPSCALLYPSRAARGNAENNRDDQQAQQSRRDQGCTFCW